MGISGFFLNLAMQHPETVEEFYQRTHLSDPGIFTKSQGHFNVFNRKTCRGKGVYSRRDFYKISFVIGNGSLYYADKGIEIKAPALVFSNPLIPSAWESRSVRQEGYFCLFTEDFIRLHDKSSALLESPIYKPGGFPVYFISPERQRVIHEIFKKMLQEIASAYLYKYDLLYNYVSILIHEALKMQPADTYFKPKNASTRIASLFLELLERQFPVDSPGQFLQFRSPADYASQLAVHVNHLNRSVKEVTGKTTSEHISERIVSESRALLMHTSWNVSEIAYALGFEYPSYFNNFFRKQTGRTPRAVRTEALRAAVVR